MGKKGYVWRLALTAVCMALIITATLIQIPAGRGYIHPGDALLYASSWMLGGGLGTVAGGLGSALADLLSGFTLYAPATLVIKGLMGLVTGLVFQRRQRAGWQGLLATAAASLWMVAGYFAYEWLIYGWAAALAGLPWNALQAAAGVVLAQPLLLCGERVSFLQNMRNIRR